MQLLNIKMDMLQQLPLSVSKTFWIMILLKLWM